MKPLTLGVLLILLGFAGQSSAQYSTAVSTRQIELQSLAETLQQRDLQDRQMVRAFALRKGIAARRELAGGRVLELQRMAPGIGPVFYITNNIVAADTVSTDEVWPSGSAGLSLDGTGMSIGEWDGGAVFADHPDLVGRVTQVDGAIEISGHSTHVAGTLVGAPLLLPDSRGMAHGAELDAYDWISDTAEMATAAAAGMLISNHSYGVAAGWIYTGDPNPPDTWIWIGGADPAIVEDVNFGYYDAESQLWDQIAVDAPYYLIVKSAGNDRTDLGPAEGEEYTVIDQNGDFIETSTAPRQPDCWPLGFDCLPTHSVAKNILTVGAVDDLPGGYSEAGGPQQVLMADFSGWGPTDDGRIKPDVVGNGMFLFSAWHEEPYYTLAAGTSMATPNVSGSLLLLQQQWENLNGTGNYLRAATLKALVIHTADEAGPAPGPDYAFGWGLLNTLSATNFIGDLGDDHQLVEGSLSNNDVHSHSVSVTSPDAILTATLVWADPPGTPPTLALDPTDLMLVNDLDLRISRGVNSWAPWVLDPANPAAAATTGDNIRDNVEQVRVFGADTCNYSVEVSHKGSLLDGLAQDYSLLISVDAPPPVGDLLIDEDFTGGMPSGWSVDTVEGVDWDINDPVPDDFRLDNNTGGSGRFAMVDNDYVQSLTYLRTPVLDLSGYESMVLRFSSYYYFDELETINVDVSTNGGTDWVQAWQNTTGFNHTPFRAVLDLSSFIAGQANVMLRFRFDSAGGSQGNLWQVDDVELEGFTAPNSLEHLPGPAAVPSPADAAGNVESASNIAWQAGTQSDSHDVYFGTVYPLTGSEFQGNQSETTFDPGPLPLNTTFFWRIDEVNEHGITKGCTWSFTTQEEMAGIIFSDGFE
jgi:hypothetical protein